MIQILLPARSNRSTTLYIYIHFYTLTCWPFWINEIFYIRSQHTQINYNKIYVWKLNTAIVVSNAIIILYFVSIFFLLNQKKQQTNQICGHDFIRWRVIFCVVNCCSQMLSTSTIRAIVAIWIWLGSFKNIFIFFCHTFYASLLKIRLFIR